MAALNMMNWEKNLQCPIIKMPYDANRAYYQHIMDTQSHCITERLSTDRTKE